MATPDRGSVPMERSSSTAVCESGTRSCAPRHFAPDDHGKHTGPNEVFGGTYPGKGKLLVTFVDFRGLA